MPDLNSLPPSASSPAQPLPARSLPHPETLARQTPSQSPRSSSVSLAATATINAGIQQQDSRRSSTSSNRNRASPQIGRSERRRSTVAMNLNLNDPSLPGPGELQSGDPRATMSQALRTTSPQTISTQHSPHRQRAPSLGEIHQELEAEQEAQVNRLLQMIRQQQIQLQALQNPSTGPSALEDSTPTSERSISFPPSHSTPIAAPRPRSPAPRASLEQLSRQSSRRSRTPSRTGSPFLRPNSSVGGAEEWMLSGGNRDESAYYQAETQTLTRENQMLRMRIRELERQLNEASAAPPNNPATPSNLAAPPIEAETALPAEDEKT